MSRPGEMLAIAAAEVAEELVSQAEFVLPEYIPIDTDLTRAAKAISFTGKITSRDEARALAIAACKLAGLSDRETAKRIGCSRNTIGPVIGLLERSGKLLPLQQRLSDKLGRVAESSADEIQRIIGEGEWDMDRSGAVKALAVAAGIATEKYLLLNGQATAIIEARAGGPPADLVADWEAKLKQVLGTVIELEPAPTPDPPLESLLPVPPANSP